MKYIPFFTVYKTDIFSSATGEIIGKRKVRIYAKTDGNKKIVIEKSFCAVLEGLAEKKGKAFKGYIHYNDSIVISEQRIRQLSKFIEQSPNQCPMCKIGFLVKQRPGKYGCTECLFKK